MTSESMMHLSGLLRVELSFFQIGLRTLRRIRRLGARRNLAHRAQYHQFRIALLIALTLEEIAQDRDIAKERKFVRYVGDAVIHEAGDDEALAVLQFEFGFRFARADGRDRGSGDGDGIREIESADLGRDVQMDVAVRLNHGGEFKADAKLTKLNGDGRDAAGVLLCHREGKFSARQKAGFLAVERDQIWFCENL